MLFQKIKNKNQLKQTTFKKKVDIKSANYSTWVILVFFTNILKWMCLSLNFSRDKNT